MRLRLPSLSSSAPFRAFHCSASGIRWYFNRQLLLNKRVPPIRALYGYTNSFVLDRTDLKYSTNHTNV
jgi:hypothetical protein